jgi:peroxiredoxin
VIRVIKILMLVTIAVLGLAVAGCSSTTDQAPEPEPEPSPASTTTPTSEPVPEANEGFNVGDRAIDFRLESLDGETVVLSDLRGSPVILNFWATWCGPCRLEMPFIQEVYEDKAWADRLVIMSVNVGEESSQVARFMEQNGLSYDVVLDKDTRVAQNYNIRGIPTTLFINKNGIIEGVKVGTFMSREELNGWLENLINDSE